MSSCPDCIFEIHQLWQSGFSKVYSNCCCNCSFETEIIKICQSSHKMYSNNIVKIHECTTILNACTKKVWKLIEDTTYSGQIEMVLCWVAETAIACKWVLILFWWVFFLIRIDTPPEALWYHVCRHIVWWFLCLVCPYVFWRFLRDI